jgi:hypothetical protein
LKANSTEDLPALKLTSCLKAEVTYTKADRMQQIFQTTISNILTRLQVSDRTEAATAAFQRGILH